MAKSFEAWERETKSTVSQLERRRDTLESRLAGKRTDTLPVKHLSVSNVQFTYAPNQPVSPNRLLTSNYLMFYVEKTTTTLVRFGASAIMNVLVPGLSYGIVNDDDPTVWFQAPGAAVHAMSSTRQGNSYTLSQSGMFIHIMPPARYRVYLYATAFPEFGTSSQTITQTYHSANLSMEFF